MCGTATHAEREQEYRHGYVHGFESAIDVIEQSLRDPALDAAHALRQADNHLLYQLSEWLDDSCYPSAPPPFSLNRCYERGARVGVLEDAYEPDHSFRRGYLAGWDAAIDSLGFLLIGRHEADAEALADARRHLNERLRAWRTCPPKGERLLPPRLNERALHTAPERAAVTA